MVSVGVLFGVVCAVFPCGHPGYADAFSPTTYSGRLGDSTGLLIGAADPCSWARQF